MSGDYRENLAACETLVDSHFLSLPLPGATWEGAAWYLMTVCDDFQRFGLFGLSLKPRHEFEQVGPAIAFGFIDEHKYAMRHALLLARRLPAGRHVWGRCIDEDGSSVAATVIYGAREYATICRFFASC